MPIALGFLINYFFEKAARAASAVLPLVSVIGISLIIMAVVAANQAKLLTVGPLVIAVVMLHNLLGYALGYLTGRALRLSKAQMRTLSIEVGMQNSGLATSLATVHFASMPLAAVPGAVFSVWHNISGAVYANILARSAGKDAVEADEVEQACRVAGARCRGKARTKHTNEACRLSAWGAGHSFHRPNHASRNRRLVPGRRWRTIESSMKSIARRTHARRKEDIMADTTSSIELGFIGFGNMAQAMAQGLVDSGALSGEHIHACAGHFDKLQASAEKLGVNAYREAAEVVRASDFVVLAVKPYLIEQVVEPVRDLLADKAVISVAAGRDFAFYEGVLAPNSRHLSTIPNTPIAVGAGVIACEQRHSLTDEQLQTFENLFGRIALIEWVDGKLLSTASSIAGCGPAFAAMFLESLGDAGVKHGLPRATAYRLAAQMMMGTAKLHLETGTHPGAMKDAVCSPGGTTIKGVAALEKDGFRGCVIDAIDAIEGE